MNRFTILIELIACLCILTGCSNLQRTNTSSDYKRAEDYIRKSEKQWAESAATGDTNVLKKILSDDFVGVDPDGGHYSKSELIHYTSDSTNKFRSNQLNDVTIRFYDNTAIAQGSETWTRYSGEPLTGSFVWTDTWIFQNGKWQIVAAEDVIAKAND
ncbi:MAG TPA: nuclear transport factor 2 family protein [Chitinophagaceae bacterium]